MHRDNKGIEEPNFDHVKLYGTYKDFENWNGNDERSVRFPFQEHVGDEEVDEEAKAMVGLYRTAKSEARQEMAEEITQAYWEVYEAVGSKGQFALDYFADLCRRIIQKEDGGG